MYYLIRRLKHINGGPHYTPFVKHQADHANTLGDLPETTGQSHSTFRNCSGIIAFLKNSNSLLSLAFGLVEEGRRQHVIEGRVAASENLCRAHLFKL